MKKFSRSYVYEWRSWSVPGPKSPHPLHRCRCHCCCRQAVTSVTATTATTATTTNKPTVDLSSAGSVSESKDTVNVTPSFTLTSAIPAKGVPATLQGSIEASLNGTSVTADVADVAKDVTLKADGGKTVYSYNEGKNTVDNNLSAVKAGKKYTMTLSGVGFSFGKANAGKTLTFKLPENVKVNDTSNDVKVILDQYGNATNLKFVISNINAYDSANTNAVGFYDAKSGLVATQGSYMTLADENGDLKVNTLLDALKGKYEAMQFQNGKFETVNVNITTTADDVKAELEKAGIKVNAAGNFEAPDTFTVTLNAKSDFNGKTASLPVVVTVPNGKSTVEPSVSKTVMHAAYYYDKNGKKYYKIGADTKKTYVRVENFD